MRLARLWAVACATILFSGCATPANHSEAPAKPEGKAEQFLAEGIRNYEDGEFKDAVTNLQTALDTGLPKLQDKVRAHKYLAFTHCVSNREKECRNEFKKALDLDPTFDLKPAEAGHPLWKNVFRSVKTKQR